MKTIGILGGMSAASTLVYYQTLCRMVADRLGGLHGPNLLIRSVDFAPIAKLQAAGDWQAQAALLNAEAKALQAGGAEILILATNTMHKVADQMREGVDLPFVHIADATADALVTAGRTRPALMATAFTMEQDFYLERLRSAGLTPIVPEAHDRAETHRIIFDELCGHIITDDSRTTYEAIATRLAEAGADALIFGCTEVGLLLSQETVPIPVFDTVEIHCQAALDLALTPN